MSIIGPFSVFLLIPSIQQDHVDETRGCKYPCLGLILPCGITVLDLYNNSPLILLNSNIILRWTVSARVTCYYGYLYSCLFIVHMFIVRNEATLKPLHNVIEVPSKHDLHNEAAIIN